jgi:hypothetical protein
VDVHMVCVFVFDGGATAHPAFVEVTQLSESHRGSRATPTLPPHRV